MPDILPLRHSIEIWSLDEGRPLGYGFASPRSEETDQTDVADVVQRWLLLDRNRKLWAPNCRVRLQEPTDHDWRITSRDIFIERASRKFTEQTYYVKANCKRAANVTTAGVTRIGPIEVPPFLPPATGSSGQTDVGVMPIFTPEDQLRGYVYTRLLETGHMLEAWALFRDYDAPGDTKVVDLGRHIGEDTTDGFARMLDSPPPWTNECSYITCACRYYSTFPEGHG